ncbi:MAG: LysM peptidoglycan-binding domain-containing protein, partial [Limosilactobacillus pontis]
STTSAKRHRRTASSVSSTSSSTLSTSSSVQSSSQSSQAGSSEVTSGDQERRFVTVQHGESVYRIAARNGMSAQELARLNNMTVRTPIHPGQQLRVK